MSVNQSSQCIYLNLSNFLIHYAFPAVSTKQEKLEQKIVSLEEQSQVSKNTIYMMTEKLRQAEAKINNGEVGHIYFVLLYTMILVFYYEDTFLL